MSEPLPPSLLFRASTPSCKPLHSLLSCLSQTASNSLHTPPSLVHIYVSQTYLVFSLNAGSKTTESSVHIQSEMFDQFQVGETANEEDDTVDQTGEFAVSLELVIQSLMVFGTSLDRMHTTLSYDRQTSIFTITLEDPSGALSSTALQGSEIEDTDLSDTLNTAFQNEAIVARVILKSKYLKEAVAEMKTAVGGDFITLTINNQQLSLSTDGDSISTTVSLPRSRTVFSSLSTSPPITHFHRYAATHFFTGMQGLEPAEETCVQMNRLGILAIQHSVVNTTTNEPCFVDFILAPAVEDADDEYASSSQVDAPEGHQISLMTGQSASLGLGGSDSDTDDGSQRYKSRRRVASFSPQEKRMDQRKPANPPQAPMTSQQSNVPAMSASKSQVVYSDDEDTEGEEFF